MSGPGRGLGRTVLAVAIGTAAVALLAVVALLVRLSYAPLDLPGVAQRIATELAAHAGDLRLTIGSARLALSIERRRVELQLLDLKLQGEDADSTVAVPAIAVLPNLRSLLRGQLQIGVIEVLTPRLRLRRAEDGRFAWSSDSRGSLKPASAPPLLALLDDPQLLPAPLRVHKLAIRGGTVVIDHASGIESLRAEDVELVLQRAGTEVVAKLSAELVAADSRAPLTARALHRRAVPRVDFTAEVSRLVPSAWVALAPALASFDLPMDLHVEGSLNSDLRPEQIHAKIGAEGMALRATAEAIRKDSRYDVSLTVSAPRATSSDVLQHWPATVAPEARRWVSESLRAGNLTDIEATARLNLTAENRPTLEALNGRFAFDGLQARFLEKMPPARAVRGLASFDRDALEVTVHAAQVSDLKITGARVRIARSHLDVDATLAGDLGRMLDVLSLPPVGLELDPRNYSGRVTARLLLGFDLDQPVRLAELDLRARAQMEEIRVAKMAPWEITAGRFDLDLQGTALRLRGTAKAAGVPFEVDLYDRLGQPGRRKVDLTAELDRNQRSALGLDAGELVDGPIALHAELREEPDRQTVAHVRADLGAARIALGSPALSKPAGAPGHAAALLRLQEGVLSAVDRLTVSLGRTRMTGRAGLSAGRWRSADLQLTFPAGGRAGRAELTLRPADDGFQLSVHSNDCGSLLPNAGATLKGGSGKFAGHLALDGRQPTLQGKLDIAKLTVTDAPLLARLTNLASLRGMQDALRDKGLLLDTVGVDLRFAGQRVTIVDAQAVSGGMWLAAAGTVDIDTLRLDLRGTLVPSYYGINRAPAQLPVIGGLVSKVTGEAIYSFDYQARGVLSDPQVTIAPASLAPGVLKKLLQTIEPR